MRYSLSSLAGVLLSLGGMVSGVIAIMSDPQTRRLSQMECLSFAGSDIVDARCLAESPANFCSSQSLGCGAGPYHPPTLGDCYSCSGDPINRRYCSPSPENTCDEYDGPGESPPLVNCPKTRGECIWSGSAYTCQNYEGSPSGNCNSTVHHLCKP
jgi:hypothetical protein